MEAWVKPEKRCKGIIRSQKLEDIFFMFANIMATVRPGKKYIEKKK